MTPDLTEATIPTLSRAQLVSAQAKLSAEIARAAALSLAIQAHLVAEHEGGPVTLLSREEAAERLGMEPGTLDHRIHRFPWCTFRVKEEGHRARWHSGLIAEYLRDPEAYRIKHGGPVLVRRRSAR